MKHVLAEVRKLGVDVQFIELNNDGYSIIDLRIIFINQNLCEEKAKEVLIHELAHFKLHSDYSVLYKMDVPHLKMEQEAVAYMMNQLIEESGGLFDYSTVLENYKLGLGWECKLR